MDQHQFRYRNCMGSYQRRYDNGRNGCTSKVYQSKYGQSFPPGQREQYRQCVERYEYFVTNQGPVVECCHCKASGMDYDHSIRDCPIEASECWACDVEGKWCGLETCLQLPKSQAGDEPHADGVMAANSDQAENVILTNEAAIDEESNEGVSTEVSGSADMCSTEKLHEFDTILNRWIPVGGFEVNTTKDVGASIVSLKLPEALFKATACTPNTLPFEQFIYTKCQVKLQVRVNANPFQCGKVLMSVVPEPNGMNYTGNGYGSVESGFYRPSVLIDLCGNNVAELDISWLFHRAFMRSTTKSSLNGGVAGGSYAIVLIQVLSKLNVADGQDKDVSVTPYFKFVSADFAAMSYRIPVSQMFKSVLGPVDSFMDGVHEVDKLYRNSRKMLNFDKPSDPFRVVQVVPKPRWAFCHTKGISDSTTLGNVPVCSTSFTADLQETVQYVDLIEIAQLWGIVARFDWKQDHARGADICTLRIDPSFVADWAKNTRQKSVPSPLECICGAFQFYRGTIELRFDFVSTEFHVGMVQISVEFGRNKDTEDDVCASASTYVKVFDLKTQKSVVITVPYIYDSVYRRMANIPMFGVSSCAGSKPNEWSGLNFVSQTLCRVRVLNRLKSPSTTAKDIEVLVLARAGKDFDLMGQIMNNKFLPSVAVGPKNFPQDGFAPDSYNNVKGVPLKIKPRSASQIKELEVNWSDVVAPTREQQEIVSKIQKKGFVSAGGQKYMLVSITGKKVSANGQWYDVSTDPLKTDWKLIDPFPQVLSHDSTLDFKPGIKFRHVQTDDECTNIKDILRKPVLIITSKEIKANSQFYIPVMPPNWEMFVSGTDAFYSEAAKQSLQVLILSLFRFYRGSQRFVIVIRSATKGVVYVHALPHSGVRIFGSQNYPKGEGGFYEHFLLGQMGTFSEIVVPYINPTVHIEVPFVTENNFGLLHQADAKNEMNANLPWRDKGDENVGHVVIEPIEDICVDVWWAAGDDFVVTGMLGSPPVDQTLRACVAWDNHGVPQAFGDFFTPVVVKSTLRAIVKPAIVAAVATVAPPLAAPAAILSYATTLNNLDNTVGRVNKTVTEVLPKVENIVGKIDRFSNIVDWPISVLSDVSKSFKDVLSELVKWFEETEWFAQFRTLLEVVSTYVQGIVSMVNLGNVFDHVGRVIQLLGFILDDAIGSVSAALSVLYRYVTAVRAQDDTIPSAALGVIVACVSAAVGASVDASSPYWWRLFKKVFHSQTWSVLVNATNFFRNIFSFLRDVVCQVLGLVDSNTFCLDFLTRKSVFLKEFVKQANFFLSAGSLKSILRDPYVKTKYWLTVVNAHQILQVLSTANELKVSPALMYICRELIRKSNEDINLLTIAPVKYEPFVLCIEGASEIGKSTLASFVVAELAKGLGIPIDAQMIYYRTPGTEFWNNYRDQPVIVYDDWMNLDSEEEATRVIGELYGMKSSAKYNPNFARLEDKDINVSPLMIILLTNDAWPRSNVIKDKKAVYRRRDVVVKARMKTGCTMSKVKKQAQSKANYSFEHLEFSFSSSSVERNLLDFQPYHKFMLDLKEKYVQYHLQEVDNVKKRARLFLENLKDNALAKKQIEDPFVILYPALVEREWEEETCDLAKSELTKRCMDLLELLGERPEQQELKEDFLAWLSLKRFGVPTSGRQSLAIKVLGDFDRYPVTWRRPLLEKLGMMMREKEDSLEMVWRKFEDDEIELDQDGLALSEMWKPWVDVCEKLQECPHLAMPPLEPAVVVPDDEVNNPPVNDVVASILVECSICGIEGIPAVMCSNSTDSSCHSMCLSCSMSSMEFSGVMDCPVCRSKTMFRRGEWPRPARRKWYLKLMDALEYLGTDVCYSAVLTAVRLLSVCLRMGAIARDGMRVFSLTTMTCDIVSGNAFGFVLKTADYALGEWLRTRMEDWIGLSFEDAMASFNNVELALEDLKKVSLKKIAKKLAYWDEFDYLPVRGQALAGLDRTKSCEGECLHPSAEELEVVLASAVYDSINDNFVYFSLEKLGNVVFSNSVCVHECQWNHNVREVFLERWWVEKAALMGVFSFDSLSIDQRKSLPPELGCVQTVKKQLPWYVSVMQMLEECVWDMWGVVVDLFQRYRWLVLAAIPCCLLVTGYWCSTVWWEGQVKLQTADVDERVWRVGLPVMGNTRFMERVRRQDVQELAPSWLLENLGQIVVKQEGGKQSWYNFLIVRKHTAVILGHFVESLRKYKDMDMFIRIIAHPDLNLPFTFDESRFSKVERGDVVLFEVPPQVPLRRDLVKYMMTKAELESVVLDVEGQIVVPPMLRNCGEAELMGVMYSQVVDRQYVSGETDSYNLELVAQYNFSRSGACGSVLLCSNHERPIFAIHAAGVGTEFSGRGFGLILYQEMFPIAQGLWDVAPLPVDEKVSPLILPEGNVIIYGRCLTGMDVYIPNRTRIVPSRLAPFLPQSSTAPVCLSGSDPRYTGRSPFRDGIAKHGVVVQCLDRSILLEVQEVLCSWIKQFKACRPGVEPLSLSENILGIEGEDYFESFPMNTSPGWPYCVHPRLNTKNKLLAVDYERKTVVAHPRLQEDLDKNRMLRLNGVRPTSVFCDLMKDERKPLGKLGKPGATRIFCASPLEYSIALRQMTMDFVAMLMKRRFRTTVAIGMDCNTEFGALFHYLRECGDLVVALDYKNFGPAFSTQALVVVHEMIISWYREYYNQEELQLLRAVLEEQVCSYHIAKDCVYQQCSGSPSGSSLTAVQNSLVNLVYIMYAWRKLSDLPLSEFFDRTRLVTYGDDLIMTVHPNVGSKFNSNSIIDVLGQYGIVATPFDKGSVAKDFYNWDEVDFLKRNFIRHPTRAFEKLGMLPWEVIEDCAKWVHKSPSVFAMSYEVAEDSVRLAWSSGPKVFLEWRDKINKILLELNMRPILLTWNELDEMAFDKGTFCFVQTRITQRMTSSRVDPE